MAPKVKNNRKRGTTTISTKHQVTIPVAAMDAAGLQAGDRLRVRTEGSAVILEPEEDALERFFGSMTGVFKDFDLDALRDEWR